MSKRVTKRRPTIAWAAAVLGFALALAGCTATPEPTPETGDVTVTGTVGHRPEISFDTPLVITESTAQTIVEGTGDPIIEGAPVLVNYRSVWANNGKVLYDTYDTGPAVIPTDASTADWISEALIGAKPGARILQMQPGTSGEDGKPGLVTVYDVLSIRAQGTPQDPRPDMPPVTLAEDGEPTVTIPPELPLPAELTVATLIKGVGEQVDAGKFVTVNYVCVSWSDGAIQNSTWETMEPRTIQIGVDNLLKGWDEGLINITVGSQVELVIPPAEGDIGRGTLVYVIDVLAVHGTATVDEGTPSVDVTPSEAVEG